MLSALSTGSDRIVRVTQIERNGLKHGSFGENTFDSRVTHFEWNGTGTLCLIVFENGRLDIWRSDNWHFYRQISTLCGAVAAWWDRQKNDDVWILAWGLRFSIINVNTFCLWVRLELDHVLEQNSIFFKNPIPLLWPLQMASTRKQWYTRESRQHQALRSKTQTKLAGPSIARVSIRRQCSATRSNRTRQFLAWLEIMSLLCMRRSNLSRFFGSSFFEYWI